MILDVALTLQSALDKLIKFSRVVDAAPVSLDEPSFLSPPEVNPLHYHCRLNWVCETRKKRP